MYRVLIVDDEMPALRFVRSIVEQFTKGFTVEGSATSGQQGLDFLREHPVDLLITDINMHGMSGIELAQRARQMVPGIHIIIISGHGEFEYAQGAIQAGVDDYLLKPVSISKATSVLQSILGKLETTNANLAATLLPSVACRRPYSQRDAAKLYGGKSFRFALIRWRNLDMTLPERLGASSLVNPGHEYFQVLRGRDDDERILIAEEGPMEDFLTNLSVYMTQPGNLSTWTAIFSPYTGGIDALPNFLDLALTMMYNQTVIGKHQILQVKGCSRSEDHVRIAAAELKQLVYFVNAGKVRMIKDYFISLATIWEREQQPQWQVWHMGRQLIHQIAAVNPALNGRLEKMLLEYNELIRCAGSYGELMSSTYAVIFESGNIRDRKLSTKELYDYAVQYIEENYAQPLSMQSVSEEIGISQTYLSRLFRNYSDTTFNAYLTRCRMDAAVLLIQEKPNLLLRDVAACVGYDDSSYFAKVFQQHTGKTPSQYAAGE